MYTVRYSGEDLPIYFDYSVIKTIKQQYEVDLTSQDESIVTWLSDLDNQEKLIFEMLKRGHKKDGVELKYGIDDMVELFSEPHFFIDSMNVYKLCALAFVTPSEKKSDEIKKKLKVTN